MKLGIFGDSFAGAKYNNNLDDSWVDILGKTFELTNYAVSGSSLYYSVDQLRKNYTKFDKIIFIATLPGRLSVPPYDTPGLEPHKFKHISSFLGVEHTLPELKKNHPNEKLLINTWEAAYTYFMYLQNPYYEQYVHRLMLNDIQHLPTNLLIIPAFKESFNHMNQGMCLLDIVEKENKHWGIDNHGELLSKSYDIRQCHLSKENNIILARKFADYLRTGRLQLRIDEFVNPAIDNKKYFIPK